MADIHDEIIAGLYRNYTEALHASDKSDVIDKGVKEIFIDLNRYVNHPKKFKEQSDILIRELEDLLDRYYHHDKEFTEQLLFEAKAYILELSEKA